MDHFEKASGIVQNWPGWKQSLLGGKVINLDAIEAKMISLLTDYDRRQSTKRGHNPNALSHYLGAISELMAEARKGKPIELAIRSAFNDRVLAIALKTIA